MPPQIDAAWATTYLKILITLLIFGMGIPATLYRMDLPEDVRRIANRRKSLLLYIPVLLFLYFACLHFVWILHPCPTDILDSPEAYEVAWIVTISVSLIVVVWWKLVHESSRSQVVRILTRSILRNFPSSKASDMDMADLVYLGQQGKPGFEKQLVIKALKVIADETIRIPRYNGSQLHEWIYRFCTILSDGKNVGTEDNFVEVTISLNRIRAVLKERCYSSSWDYFQIGNTLGQIALNAIKQDYAGVVTTCIEEVRYESRVLHSIGESAHRNNHYQLAQTALHKLECLAESKGLESGEEVHNLLGLLALWAEKDETRLRAKSYIDYAKDYFKPSLDKCIEAAAEYHYRGARFDIAHKVRNLQSNLVK